MAILVQIMLSELDAFKRAENLKRRIKYEYPEEHHLRELFETCDTRKQGRLDRFDLFRIGQTIDDDFSVQSARRALFKMDYAEKGFLTFEDFQSYLKPYEVLPESYLDKFDAGENDNYYLNTERDGNFGSPQKKSKIVTSEVHSVNQSLEEMSGLDELTKSMKFDSMNNSKNAWKRKEGINVDVQNQPSRPNI